MLLSGRGEAGAGRSEQAVRDSGADAEIAKAAGREVEYLPVTPQELESGMVEPGCRRVRGPVDGPVH